MPCRYDAVVRRAGCPQDRTRCADSVGEVLRAFFCFSPQGLDDDLKKRVYVVHVSESSIPKDSGLKVAPAGVENTMRLDTIANIHEEALDALDLICSVGILSGVTVAQVCLLAALYTWTFYSGTLVGLLNAFCSLSFVTSPKMEHTQTVFVANTEKTIMPLYRMAVCEKLRLLSGVEKSECKPYPFFSRKLHEQNNRRPSSGVSS